MMPACRAWLEDCGLDRRGYRNWWVEILLRSDARPSSELELRVYPDEWGVVFRHREQCSMVRQTERGYVIARDEHSLAELLHELRTPGTALCALERRFEVTFRRYFAEVRSNVPDAPLVVRRWLVAL